MISPISNISCFLLLHLVFMISDETLPNLVFCLIKYIFIWIHQLNFYWMITVCSYIEFIANSVFPVRFNQYVIVSSWQVVFYKNIPFSWKLTVNKVDTFLIIVSCHSNPKVIVTVVRVIHNSTVHLINRNSYIGVLTASHSHNCFVSFTSLINLNSIRNCSWDYFQNSNSLIIFNKFFKWDPENTIISFLNIQVLSILSPPCLTTIRKVSVPLKFSPRISNL